ncbi:chromosome segregation protein SMC [Paenalcaligenes hermetiae]|uniref:chromosome segregation protein SMC n=1 Tax=Paenalcaligenes hermetiae TaxID=1157987 RepID=UPI0031E87F9F
MRLTQIKLSGFKSFVDTTVIPTPSQLVGVVGPNGCGKSNIIDAVRWVLGESRASELRGGSMQDVIFNGSDQRKPAARASVELTFDNAEGRITGQWGAYTEIAVRRELTRDGTSGYFINGQQVRRRDINDMFLGTGLGARGYAIIGQGMINRLIEAKPEELRVYLEEAAGVSRYKERRKETESRLRDTRENLTRLEDILQELEQQLIRLEAQAEVAKTYQALQAEGEKKQHVLWWLKENQAREEQKRHFLAIEQAQNEVEAAMATMRNTEARIEQLRQQHFDATEQVQKAQGGLYQINATVSRIEADIQHANTAQTRMEQRQQQLEQQKKEWEQLHQDSAAELEQKQLELEELAGQIEESLMRIEQMQEQLEPAEQQQHQLQAKRDQLVQQQQEAKHQVALAEQRRQSLQQQQEQLLHRQRRYQEEWQQLHQAQPQEIERLHEQATAAEQKAHASQRQLQELEQALDVAREQQQQKQKLLHEQQQLLTQIEAQLTALESVQQQVQRQEELEGWLSTHGFARKSRLWQMLQVEPGWEQAVEAVLGQRLQALVLKDWSELTSMQASPPARVGFSKAEQELSLSPATNAVDFAEPLFNKIRLKDSAWETTLAAMLAHVYSVPTFSEALAQRAKLPAEAMLVTPEGHIVQAYQVLLYAADSEQAGVLARQQLIEEQKKAAKAQRLHVDVAQTQFEQAQQHVEQTRLVVQQQIEQVQTSTQQMHEQRFVYQQALQLQQQAQQRKQQLKQEIEEITEQLDTYRLQSEEIALQQEELAWQIEELNEHIEQYQEKLTDIDDICQQLRQQLREIEQQHQRLQYNKSLIEVRVDELLRSQQQAFDLAQRTQMELAGLESEYEHIDVDELHAMLQEALEQRVEQEDQVQQQQKHLAELAMQLQDLEQNRHQTGDGIEPLRQRVIELQLAEQAARMTVEQYAEQLNAQQVDRQDLAAFMQDQPESWHKVTWLQTEVQRVNRAITALGAVNLAALEELRLAQERQQYLQSQHDDLTQAIETLENAIRKIDRETRALLQSTFNEVNQHFGNLFPQLFGGGEAKLMMTGDEILDAGVQVMAQPPGKRNSTIQLLSGGEKALTATALVFAFFKLNPAPFCLLDEVDAPLDDANTERYANLVQSMSDQTQFLFISHNKIAMQMAKQLVGVTMQEQGVSRIVAVDMAAAVEMAQ